MENDKLFCRVIVIRQDRALERYVAVEEDGQRLRLPCLEISRGYRLAAGLTLAMKQRWGWTGVYTPIPVFANETCQTDFQYRVMECEGEQRPPGSEVCWKPSWALAAAAFRELRDYRALRMALETACCPCDRDNPFARLGWFHEVSAWVQQAIAPLGFKAVQQFQQWNAAPAFSLIRFSTDKGGVWFKAAGPPNGHELSLTRELSVLSPEHSARLLAEKPEWNAWLSAEAQGAALEDTPDLSGWMLAAKSLAKLQIASAHRASRLIEEGAADLTAGALLELCPSFFKAAWEWMQEPPNDTLARLSSGELLGIEQQVREAVHRTGSGGVPETLGHLDPNPGNVIVSPKGSCVFLDWAEGYVGYPFISFEYLLLHFRRSPVARSAGEASLEQAYWNDWKALVSGAELDTAKRLTPLLAVFCFAVHIFARSQTNRMLDSGTVALLRSLMRRMKREADLLRTQCDHGAVLI